MAAAGLVLLDVETGLGPNPRHVDVERGDAAVEGIAGGHQVVGIQGRHLLSGKPGNWAGDGEWYIIYIYICIYVYV